MNLNELSTYHLHPLTHYFCERAQKSIRLLRLLAQYISESQVIPVARLQRFLHCADFNTRCLSAGFGYFDSVSVCLQYIEYCIVVRDEARRSFFKLSLIILRAGLPMPSYLDEDEPVRND